MVQRTTPESSTSMNVSGVISTPVMRVIHSERSSLIGSRMESCSHGKKGIISTGTACALNRFSSLLFSFLENCR